MGNTTLPTPPQPTFPWVDSSGRPTQQFSQWLVNFVSALQSLLGSIGSSQSQSSSGSATNPTINTQSASYTLGLADNGNIVEMNSASANNLTVPSNSSVPFPIGSFIPAIVQIGAGQTTIVAGSGVTILSKNGNLALAAQYSAVTLYKRAINTWLVAGDLVT